MPVHHEQAMKTKGHAKSCMHGIRLCPGDLTGAVILLETGFDVPGDPRITRSLQDRSNRSSQPGTTYSPTPRQAAVSITPTTTPLPYTSPADLAVRLSKDVNIKNTHTAASSDTS